MYADGMSPAKIATIPDSEGIHDPCDRKWSGAIRGDRIGILNNEIYIGRS
ncbi:hypothetical protein G6L37_22565 [Agrobacterium rubi]|nr:hypothetical protein [Agrobacterium rubi]NTF28041.1 hypothetical protein [Agrobacterium rubi]